MPSAAALGLGLGLGGLGTSVCSSDGEMLALPIGGGGGSFRLVVPSSAREVDARRICAINDVQELRSFDYPPCSNIWLILQVHRVWLNDPALTVLNVSNTPMPASEQEPRVIPKLFEALRDNTRLEVLKLNGCQLKGRENMQLLVNSLTRNRTLKTLELENNFFSIQDLMILFSHLDTCSGLEVLRLVNQHGVSEDVLARRGDEIGATAWRTLATSMHSNTNLKKLGLYLTEADPGSRDKINKALIRNNDASRQHRQSGG